MKITSVLAVFLLTVTPALGQMVRQCQCSEVQGCKDKYVRSVIPCADRCQTHVRSIGASYPALRQCLVSREGKFIQTMRCVEGQNANSCARGSGGMVQKRYPETLKIAAMTEINGMLNRLGIGAQVKGLMSTGKKLFNCMRKCVDKAGGACGTRLGCGLSLPSDNILVQQAKQCAIQSGFNTFELQQICNCAVNAGVRQLAGICNRIQIV
ncbi:hypothetical protein FO519_005481 [Halicephalobus sp. NKZ332]|nr:hypothetical protein FO519_005481 [Halicephalobus sp. NKZ332]